MPGHAEPLASPGCLNGGEPAIVQRIEPDLDLRLTDGRLVRLSGLATLEDAPAAEATADRLRRWLVDQPVRVAPFGAGPDRWGRTPGLVFADGSDGRPVSVGEALLDAGLAEARPGADIAPCWSTYLGLENSAREGRRGLWSAAGAVAPGDAAALQAHLGRYVVIEGQVESAFEGRARTYLRFTGDLAVSFERRTGLRLEKAGLDPGAWVHRRLRVRGVLDDRWGLQIEVTSPEQIEVLGP